MRRIFLFFALFYMSLNAYVYNDSLLLIYAKIIPRIMLLDYTKSDNSAIKKLCILYENGDRLVAKRLKELITRHLPKEKTKFSIRIVAKPYKESEKCDKVSAIVMLDAEKEKIHKVVEFAKKNRILTFSYNKSLLREGAAISLSIGKEIYPIINLSALKSYSLKLDPLLFQIAKIYSEGNIK